VDPEHVVEWVEAEPAWMGRAGHAVRDADGRVWVFDPFDDEDAFARVRALGEPAGVVQLLDRHRRDCAGWAQRLGVEHHVVPRSGLPFAIVGVVGLPTWREVAAWLPDSATLVVADALAASPGYTARDDVVGVHPFLRLRPPRALGRLPVEHLLFGHGPGLHGAAAGEAVAEALRTARSRAPRFALDSVRRLVSR